MFNVGFTVSAVDNGYIVRVDGDPSRGPSSFSESVHIAQSLEEVKQIIGEVFVTKKLENEGKRHIR